MSNYAEQNLGYLKAIGFSLGWGFVFTLFFTVGFPFFGFIMLEHSNMLPTIGNILMANGSLGSMIAILLFLGTCLDIQKERKQLAKTKSCLL